MVENNNHTSKFENSVYSYREFALIESAKHIQWRKGRDFKVLNELYLGVICAKEC